MARKNKRRTVRAPAATTKVDGPSRWVSLAEAGQMLKKSRQWAWMLMRLGHFKKRNVAKPGMKADWEVLREDVDAYLGDGGEVAS